MSDPTQITITRNHVEQGDLTAATGQLQALREAPDQNFQGAVIHFDGFELTEVRTSEAIDTYLKGLNADFPYWLWYMADDAHNHAVIAGFMCRGGRVDPVKTAQFAAGAIGAFEQEAIRAGLSKEEAQQKIATTQSLLQNALKPAK